jgi:hypothetical protein
VEHGVITQEDRGYTACNIGTGCNAGGCYC